MIDAVIGRWIDCGFTVFQQPEFEADDFAGTLVRSLGTDDRALLITVDSDWGQLVSDRVIWLDTYCATVRSHTDQKPSVLDIPQVIRRWNSYDKNSIDPISNPRDIVDRKHVYGDPADAIPGDQRVPIGIIDLLNPIEYTDDIDLNAIRSGNCRYAVNPLPSYCYGVRSWLGYTIDLDTMQVTNIPDVDR
jgi:5'-3' exonuclease